MEEAIMCKEQDTKVSKKLSQTLWVSQSRGRARHVNTYCDDIYNVRNARLDVCFLLPTRLVKGEAMGKIDFSCVVDKRSNLAMFLKNADVLTI